MSLHRILSADYSDIEERVMSSPRYMSAPREQRMVAELRSSDITVSRSLENLAKYMQSSGDRSGPPYKEDGIVLNSSKSAIDLGYLALQEAQHVLKQTLDVLATVYPEIEDEEQDRKVAKLTEMIERQLDGRA